MTIWIVLASMFSGALISEMYHARMWKLYRQGKNEGLKTREKIEHTRNITMYK